MKSPNFESGIVKFKQTGRWSYSNREARSRRVLLNGDTDSDSNEATESNVQQSIKCLKPCNVGSTSLYIDTRLLLPTVNLFQRVFSNAGHTLTNRRKGIFSSNFESQLFLYMNQIVWGIEDPKHIAHGWHWQVFCSFPMRLQLDCYHGNVPISFTSDSILVQKLRPALP